MISYLPTIKHETELNKPTNLETTFPKVERNFGKVRGKEGIKRRINIWLQQ